MNKLSEIFENEDRFEFKSYRKVKLEDIKAFPWSELSRNNNGSLVLVPFCQYGDYSCAVERSNFRIFMESYGSIDGIYEVYGGYGSRGIVLDLNKVGDNEDIAGTILDDQDMSMLEIEIENENFDSWIRSDFEKSIINFINEDDFELPEDFDLRGLYEKLKDLTNTYFDIEAGGNGYIDIKRLMKGFNREMLGVKNEA